MSERVSTPSFDVFYQPAIEQAPAPVGRGRRSPWRPARKFVSARRRLDLATAGYGLIVNPASLLTLVFLL